MSVAERIRTIRESRGDSIRDAEHKTGISRGTLHRIEQGYTPRNLRETVERFAAGYGVAATELMVGQTPNGVFEWRIRRLDRRERLRLIMAGLPARVHLALDFLADQFPHQVDAGRLALASALPITEVESALRLWRFAAPDRKTAEHLANGIHALVEISHQWLLTGCFADETGLRPPVRQRVPVMGVLAQKARPVSRASTGRVIEIIS